MNTENTGNTLHKPSSNLRNFDLTVDEIRLMKTIDSMTKMVKKIEQLEPQSPRVKNIHSSIRKLQEQLDDIRDNTLIR